MLWGSYGKREPHLHVRNAVLQKFVRNLHEPLPLVERLRIGLRFNENRGCGEHLPRHADRLGDNAASEPAAALHGNHAAKRRLRKGRSGREHPRIGLDPVLVLEPDVVGLRVRLIHLLIGAALLHHEDRDPELVA